MDYLIIVAAGFALGAYWRAGVAAECGQIALRRLEDIAAKVDVVYATVDNIRHTDDER